MKKGISLFLSVLIACSLTSCGGKSEDSSAKNSSESSKTEELKDVDYNDFLTDVLDDSENKFSIKVPDFPKVDAGSTHLYLVEDNMCVAIQVVKNEVEEFYLADGSTDTVNEFMENAKEFLPVTSRDINFPHTNEVIEIQGVETVYQEKYIEFLVDPNAEAWGDPKPDDYRAYRISYYLSTPDKDYLSIFGLVFDQEQKEEDIAKVKGIVQAMIETLEFDEN